MQAVVVHDLAKGPALEDVEVDEPRAGEVLVRIAASGICGSDLHVLHGRSSVTVLPCVLGHEGAGVVEAVGPGVATVAPGDHVVVALYGPCLKCHNCLTGNIAQCDGEERIAAISSRMADGSTRLHQGPTTVYPFVGAGTLAEQTVVRETQVVKIAPDVPLDVICLAGCGVTTGLGAVFNIGRPGPGDTVAVVGCGGVGLNVVQGARLAGAKRIIAIDTNPVKLDLAADFGATDVVRGDETPMLDEVRRLVPGGVDVAFEVVGIPQLMADTLELTRPGGTCVVVGSMPPGAVIPVRGAALFQERRLLGCLGGSNIPQRDIPRIVDLYRGGRIRLDELIGKRVGLPDFAAGIAATEAGEVARSVVTMAS
ncbi:MAG TPA: zinc-binding dehydrogenase [Acidimicrobiia bacterium]|nr:zinc-binding dehydrogenase [Acidimicrobiia bacterium]